MFRYLTEIKVLFYQTDTLPPTVNCAESESILPKNWCVYHSERRSQVMKFAKLDSSIKTLGPNHETMLHSSYPGLP